MISARHWRERRTFLSALLFWGWLAAFIFSFAANDAFHGAHCPEQWALASAHHHDLAGAQLTAGDAVHFDTTCIACLLQVEAQGILALVPPGIAPITVALTFPISRPIYRDARALNCSARGPPVSFI